MQTKRLFVRQFVPTKVSLGVLLVLSLFWALDSHGHYYLWIQTFVDDEKLAEMHKDMPNDLGPEELYTRLVDRELSSYECANLFGELRRRNTPEGREAIRRVVEGYQTSRPEMRGLDEEVFYPMALLCLAKMESGSDIHTYTENLDALFPLLPNLEHHLLQYHASKELEKIGTTEARGVLISHLDKAHVASDSCSEALADLELGELTDEEFFASVFQRVQDGIRMGHSIYGESVLAGGRVEENTENERYLEAAIKRANSDPMSTEAFQAEYLHFLERQTTTVRNLLQQDPAMESLLNLSKQGEKSKLSQLAYDSARKPYTRKNAYRCFLELELRDLGIEGREKAGYLLQKLEGKPIYPDDSGAVAVAADEASREKRVTRLLLNLTVMRMIWNQGEIAIPVVENALGQAKTSTKETPERLASLAELAQSLRRQAAARQRLKAWQAVEQQEKK